MSEINVQPKKEKYIYLEVIRIIAMFFVIFNHTGIEGFFLYYQQDMGSFSYWIYLFISIFCKFSVSIFFMISGALMLGKEESIKTLWKKRISKMIVILIAVSTFYYIVDLYTKSGVFNFENYLSMLYTGKGQKYHLWYLNLYIAYLISLPFLRLMAKNLDKKSFSYLIGIAIMYIAILPILENLIFKSKYTLNGSIKASWLVTNIALYPLIGYYLHNKIEINNIKRCIPLALVANALCIIISCCLNYINTKGIVSITENQLQVFHSNFIIVNCITIFITIKYLFNNIKLKNFVKKLILSLGECTFGVYLIHILFMESKYSVYLLDKLHDLGINQMIVAILWCICTMIVSYLVVYIYKKIIKFIKYIVKNKDLTIKIKSIT